MAGEPFASPAVAVARLTSTLSILLLSVAATLGAMRLRFLDTPSAVLLVWVAVVIVAGALGLARANWLDRIGPRPFAALLAALVLVPRIAWVMVARSEPIADFLLYHRYAVRASQGRWHDLGPVFPAFPFKLSYPAILAFPYRWFGPEPIVAAGLNVGLSLVLAWQVWRLARQLGGERAGRWASIVFALWPAQIYFCSVVGQEHLFAVPLLEAAIVLLSIEARASRLVRSAAWSGALLAAAHFIRSVGVLLAPAIVLFVGLAAWRGQPGAWRQRARFLAIAALSAAIAFAVFTVPLGRWLGVPLWRSSGAFSLLIGTNADARGMWTPEAERFANEQGWDYDAIDREASRLVRDRLRQPGVVRRLVARKFGPMWGSDEFGISFATAKLSGDSAWTARINTVQPALEGIGDAFHVSLLLLVVVATILAWRSPLPAALFVESLFLVHVVAFTFLELQTRYHFLVTPFWIALAAAALTRRDRPEREG